MVFSTSPVRSFFGNWYEPPKKEGPSNATRSGIPPPKINLGTDKPQTGQNNVGLALHLNEIRERARGMTPEEREWRK